MAGKPLLDLKGLRVFVAGHKGMVGSAVGRRLASEDCTIVTADHRVLDLTQQAATHEFIARTKPDIVIVAAARVGGILANNSFPVDFLSDNLLIAANLIGAAHSTKVRKLLFLGSSCIFPREAPQPMSESLMLTGPLEPTNQWYAVAKIAGIKLCEAYRMQYGDDFISVMPSNLYGPGDNYHPAYSHVPAGLIRRMHEAKVAGDPKVTIWGTGSPLREFLYVDDFADACVFALKHYSESEFLNVGTANELTIREFAHLVASAVGYQGEFVFDTSLPDGTPRKLLDISKLTALGWSAKTDLVTGLALTYADFVNLGHRPRTQFNAKINYAAR
jgi:GDP-L-fucose synthase